MEKELIVNFREAAEKYGAYKVLQHTWPGRTIRFPYYERMAELSVDELGLSVRAVNALRRKGAHTLRAVAELMEKGELKNIRNLGVKTEKEIIRRFFCACYENMTLSEKNAFWEGLLT